MIDTAFDAACRAGTRADAPPRRAMNAADTIVPANMYWVSAGHTPRSATNGISSSDGSGFHTKPIAARCGSRPLRSRTTPARPACGIARDDVATEHDVRADEEIELRCNRATPERSLRRSAGTSRHPAATTCGGLRGFDGAPARRRERRHHLRPRRACRAAAPGTTEEHQRAGRHEAEEERHGGRSVRRVGTG